MSASRAEILRERIGIIGAGVSGLINAHVLLQDGFTDVTLITRDKYVGGTWMRGRVYPGLYMNSVHGEFNFSAMEMPLPENSAESGGRLSGQDVCNYMEKFTEKYLAGKAKFIHETEVLNIERDEQGKWNVAVKDIPSGSEGVMTFSRIILSTGGLSNAYIPAELSREAAGKAGFSGLIIHSSQFASCLDEILDVVKPTRSNEREVEGDIVLVVGCGKSAQDVCAKLANEGRKVIVAFEKTVPFVAGPKPTPDFIRKSRLLSALSPHITLSTRLERFLHATTIGGAITQWFWSIMSTMGSKAYSIPEGSSLRRTYPLYWHYSSTDEGIVRNNSFHALATAGVVRTIAPARMVGYANDGKSVILSNGETVKPKVVVLATGYQSSWTNIFTVTTAEELGISKYIPQAKVQASWNYPSLKNAPAPQSDGAWVTPIYRGLVPAKNIARRDFAIAGALYAANFTHTTEVAAHWISSYFQGDDMRLPGVEDALKDAEEHAAWTAVRFPDTKIWKNPSSTANVHFFTWPQAVDQLLVDMHLPSMRSDGNWLNWVFKVVSPKEIATLGEERRAKREASSLKLEVPTS
ncbi:hypothetical protein B0H34DRAFT_650867 [Crassisporium funariophilum]|nr:hypothetical protein B0H34DRAFT_650867 [Crassisporium funariophilum]